MGENRQAIKVGWEESRPEEKQAGSRCAGVLRVKTRRRVSFFCRSPSKIMSRLGVKVVVRDRRGLKTILFRNLLAQVVQHELQQFYASGGVGVGGMAGEVGVSLRVLNTGRGFESFYSSVLP